MERPPAHARARARRVPASPRPRYRRLTAAAGALGITLVAVLGGVGILPVEPDTASAALRSDLAVQQRDAQAHDGLADSGESGTSGQGDGRGERSTDRHTVPTVPANSGTGRRIVFAMADQRVWLVERSKGHDKVARTYLVSGSVTDNLRPGRYAVYSKSLHAVGIEDSGTMQYMVRFTRGQNAAIGFHDIPVLDGAKVQTRAELGTPRSHGCIRQWRPDAKALWAFAPVGTEVDVVA